MSIDRFRLLTPEEKDRIRQEIVDNCDLMGDCWIWRGAKTSSGYGIKYIQGRMRTVSRFMLAYSTRESLDTRQDACHKHNQCPYRACCNPQHLFWGSHAVNSKDRERYERESRESRLRELSHLYPQPSLGHESVDIQRLARMVAPIVSTESVSSLVS